MNELDYFISGLKGSYLVCVEKDGNFDMSHNMNADEAILIIDYLMDHFGIEYVPTDCLN